ncbi:MAG: hypothetical protein H0W25_02190, partial [Acidimicrobiia bacterium]|nr:hypothetical protein [Acidimicrobiia bacterium]
MLRSVRSSRLVLWFVAALAAAVATGKVLRGRSQPLPAAAPTGAGTRSAAASAGGLPDTPVVPIVQPKVVEVGEVEAPGEPPIEDAGPAPAPAVKKAMARKAAPKKATPAKAAAPTAAAAATKAAAVEKAAPARKA